MSDRLLKKQLRTNLLKANPAAISSLLVELQDALETRLELKKGDKGDIGPVGPRGAQGESIRGPRGERGEKGEPGKDGRDGQPGRDGTDGRDGRDADFSPLELYANFEKFKKEVEAEKVTAEQVVKLINSLRGNDRIDASAIKNLPTVYPTMQAKKKIDFNDLRWHGGGDTVIAGSNVSISTNSSGQKVISASATPTTFIDNESVAGSGTAWTLANTPTAGSVHLHAQRMRLYPTDDYTITGANIITTLSYSAGDLLADYRT